MSSGFWPSCPDGDQRLRSETESLYAWSMPQDLSPAVGHGNPAYRQSAVAVHYDPQWLPRPVTMPPDPPLAEELSGG